MCFLCFIDSLQVNSDIYITNNTITHVSTRQGIMAMDTQWTQLHYSIQMSITLLILVTIFTTSQMSKMLPFRTSNSKMWQQLELQPTECFYLMLSTTEQSWSIWFIWKMLILDCSQDSTFNGLLSKVSYTNMYFENILIGDNNRMISTGEFKTVEINNITFINVPMDNMYQILRTIWFIIDIINLNSATNSSISNIYVQSSTANLLKMQSVVGSTVTPVYMNFQNITYRDSYVKLKQSFILFSNVESQEQFYTVFDQVTFNNLTFRSGGYLMDFGHQTLTQVVVSNLVFTNVYAGTIHLEASYKVLPYKTNVLVQNGKFENVNKYWIYIFTKWRRQFGDTKFII